MEEIRTEVFMWLCTCNECKAGNYDNLCMSANKIARTLTNRGVKTLRGKDVWQATSVNNLFYGAGISRFFS